MSLRPALVLGLDGASFDVIRPLVAAGRLPNLARWLETGSANPLASTVPPMTFPAWSSFLTGLSPGEHGIFDFSQKVAGQYRIRFVNSSDRSGASMFARVSAAGGSVLALGMPATFPPERVKGLLVSGFDAPVSTGTDASSASDPKLYEEIAARVGPWMRPALRESADEAGWHERALEILLDRVERKKNFALEALRTMTQRGLRPDLLCIVFSESDTVAHHYWRDHDANSPRHDPNVSAERRDAIARVYEALDAACGELRQAFSKDALCCVVSDHGTGGASRRVVHLNRRLEECDLLERSPANLLDVAARSARDTLLRTLPPSLAQWAFRRARGAAARFESTARFAGYDWSRTQAFSEEANTQPGVWINLAGRESHGCVSASDYERVRGDVIAALLDWKLPGGEPVVARARRREEIYAGPHVERAPDVVLELALEDGYAHSLVATPWLNPERGSVHTLGDDELAGGRGRGMNGTHRPDGVWLACGERLASLSVSKLADVAPALLHAMGVAGESPVGDGAEPRLYTAEEEAQVQARLRALGYLE